MTPNESRRHHSPKGNICCVGDELLALVLQMIVSSTLNSLSQDLDLVERRFEWKATWERLEIKIHMVGMEYLGSQHMSRWFSLRTYELEL